MTPSATRLAVATACLLAMAALAAACGSVSPSASGQSSPAAGTTSRAAHTGPGRSPTPAVTATPGAGCSSSALKVVVDVGQAGGAAGSVYYPINFTNTSASTCTLYGYPGVSFVSGKGGTQLGRPASRNPAGPPVTVTLTAGSVAHATVQVAQAGNYPRSDCRPVTAHWLKIYPPNQFVPVYAHFTTQACSARLPGNAGGQLSVFAMRPGPGKRGHTP